ncbi:MAG: HAD family phosphatase [Spirochaetes bacterium]|nr:HAD family phosphatase [Spirochaetota bacterium]
MFTPEEIKAVGADLDGTLLPESKVITPFTINVIEKLINRGIKFFPVTGKSLSLTRKIFGKIDVPMVALEGAYIRVNGQNLWDYSCFIEPGLARKILENSEKTDAFLISNDRVYTKGNVPYKRYGHWACDYEGSWEKSSLKNLTVIVFLSRERRFLEDLRSSICRQFDGFIVPYLVPVMYYNRYILTIRSLNISKFKGTVRLLDHFNLSADEMLFLGDWRNDIPMFKRIGFPVAMRNAEPDVAQYAKAVTMNTNEEDGAARFLSGFFNL